MDVEIWKEPKKDPSLLSAVRKAQAKQDQPEEKSARENLKNLVYSELITCKACAETVSYALHKIMKAVDSYAYDISVDSADSITDE